MFALPTTWTVRAEGRIISNLTIHEAKALAAMMRVRGVDAVAAPAA